MHVTSGRWLYGFLLALTTTLLWGVLPIMLKQVLQGMDAATVSWYRMLSSGVVLLIWLGGVVMMAGGVISLLDRRLRVGAPARRKTKAVPAGVAAE